MPAIKLQSVIMLAFEFAHMCLRVRTHELIMLAFEFAHTPSLFGSNCTNSRSLWSWRLSAKSCFVRGLTSLMRGRESRAAFDSSRLRGPRFLSFPVDRHNCCRSDTSNGHRTDTNGPCSKCYCLLALVLAGGRAAGC